MSSAGHRIIAATDGAANRGGTAWAWTLKVPAASRDPDLPTPFLRWECAERLPEGSTAQRAEVMGLIECLEFLSSLQFSSAAYPVEVKCDSRYILCTLVEGGTGPLTFPPSGWIEGWVSRGWSRGSGGPPAHLDLWKRGYELARRLCTDGKDITLRWVKGHAVDPDNTRADALAVKASLLSR